MTGFQPDLCQCGHPAGDHSSRPARFPHPVHYGACLIDGCECRQFSRLLSHDERRDLQGEAQGDGCQTDYARHILGMDEAA